MFMFKAQFGNDAPLPSKAPTTEKTKIKGNLWYPDLDSLMVALSLHECIDNETISCSSSESFELEENTVRFGTLEIREYKVTKGEHPFCRDGLALSLDWEYKQLPSINIEHLEDDVEDDAEFYDQDDLDDEEMAQEEGLRDDNVDYINTRPKRLNYFERRLLLEQVGFKVEDCYGDVRSSVWLGVDEELPPTDEDDEEHIDSL
jgi:hypothetical protein